MDNSAAQVLALEAEISRLKVEVQYVIQAAVFTVHLMTYSGLLGKHHRQKNQVPHQNRTNHLHGKSKSIDHRKFC
jgi:glycogen synthase